MTSQTLPRRVWAATVGDLLDLALAQPHQVMLSTGSVAIMAQFAAHSGIVDPRVGYCIAIGIEWAYLRGLASAAKSPTRWAATLNWSAFAVVVLWGVLWVATVYGALPERPTGGAAFWLAVAHVVPIAWLSLCSAMCHQAGATRTAREAERQRVKLEAEADDDRRAERERQQRQRDRADELEAQRRAALVAIEAEKAKALARLEYRTAKASQPPSQQGVTATVTAASQSPRDVFQAAVIAAFRDDPQFNRSELARAHGWSRPMVDKLIKEAQQRGLL